MSTPNLLKIVEYVLCLPGTSASVERVFSLMKNCWSAERGRMSSQTVKSLLTIKFNCEHSCSEFYELVKKNKEIIRKAASSEKYSFSERKEPEAGPSCK